MSTFLPQNQFNSASSSDVDEAGASTPAPLCDAPANLSNPDRGYMGHGLPPALGTLVRSAASGSVRTEAADCSDHNLKFVYECIDGTMFHRCDTCGGKAYLNATDDIPEIFRVANLLCETRQFVPDYPGIYQAMLDPTSPRALETDPVWADEAPLFLKDIA